MAKIVRVNVTRGEVSIEAVPESYMMLGGRGLTSRIVLDEVDPNCEPLGGLNKLVIAPGLLTGTNAPSSARISIGAKSPLTGGIKESNAGGTVARKLARLGIKAIIIEGKPLDKSSYILNINNHEISLLPAQDLSGLGNYETVARLQEKYGANIGVISIGQAGEAKMSNASVAITDMEGLPTRHCGRGGMGAVMGSKGIKAIIVDDSGSSQLLIEIEDKEGFNEICRSLAKTLIETKVGLKNFGTASLVDPTAAIGAFPTRNYSRGYFENKDKINGKALQDLIVERGGKYGHSCSPGCVIRCSNVVHDAEGKYLTSGLEYETIGLCGSNLEIDSLDVISTINYKCDDYGIDTMETGVAIGVAMEAGIAKFGDAEAAIKLVDEIGNNTLTGRILGQGATITGKVLGVTRVPAVKGQSFAAYDPRALKGNAYTYATTPMGADHTAGNCLPGRGAWRGQVDPNKKDYYLEVSRDLQIYATVLDVMGFCNFVGISPAEMEIIAKLLSKATGKEVTVADVEEIGKDTIRTELEFNRRAGFTKADDRLPEFCKFEKLPPKDLYNDIEDEELDRVLDF
ncbi:MAG: aldehyde ferredoxin oxidoreductase [Syntrophomonadaceae bacterium]|nr:aldehyde ferredoxin oxidoreductase [Syntrophomonadaceae bacterium]